MIARASPTRFFIPPLRFTGNFFLAFQFDHFEHFCNLPLDHRRITLAGFAQGKAMFSSTVMESKSAPP